MQLRLLNVTDENLVTKGDVLTHLDDQMPVSDLFEAELDVFELLSYKPILSKGYQCILHIHTVADEATVKDIMVCYEKNDKGEITEKQRPQFAKSFSKVICRIQTRAPIPLEKHDYLPQLGKFTLRDEGRTIAVGKVLKYKPVKVNTFVAPSTATTAQTQQVQPAQIEVIVKEDMVYDMETGETVSKSEYEKRKKERDELEGINEDEDDDEEEDN